MQYSRTGPVLLIAQVVCVAAALSAAGMVAAALISRPTPWFFLGFELVTILAGIMGFRTARGVYSDGPALSLICVAGIVAVAALLGYLGAGKRLLGVDLKLFLLARVAAGGVLAMVSAWLVLSRRPGKSLPLIWRGIALGGICAVLLGAMWFGRGLAANLNEVVRLVLGVVLSAVCLGFFAASVHNLIRAFEFGRLPVAGSDSSGR